MAKGQNESKVWYHCVKIKSKSEDAPAQRYYTFELLCPLTCLHVSGENENSAVMIYSFLFLRILCIESKITWKSKTAEKK